MDVARLLDEEERDWRALHAVFARIGEDRWEEPTVTPEGWSPKDVMFHVGGWLADCARVLDRIEAGTFDRDADEDVESTNRAWFALSREMDRETVRAGFESARTMARSRFASLATTAPEAWEWFEESGPLHYRAHAADLEAWLG